MSGKDDPFGYEEGPEASLDAATRLEADLEYLGRDAERWVQHMAEELKIDEERVYRLAAIFFGRFWDLTKSPDKVVLVVHGKVTPYANALQALVLDDREDEAVVNLLARLNTTGVDEPR